MDKYEAPGREHIQHIHGAPYVPLWVLGLAEGEVNILRRHIEELRARVAVAREERDAIIGLEPEDQMDVVVSQMRETLARMKAGAPLSVRGPVGMVSDG